MSKRAEEVALREYPPSYSEVNRNAKRIQSYKVDTHKPIRQIYIKGYEQAEKDTIERAVNVLINLPSLVIPSNYIAYFRKKMMEEE